MSRHSGRDCRDPVYMDVLIDKFSVWILCSNYPSTKVDYLILNCMMQPINNINLIYPKAQTII